MAQGYEVMYTKSLASIKGRGVGSKVREGMGKIEGRKMIRCCCRIKCISILR